MQNLYLDAEERRVGLLVLVVVAVHLRPAHRVQVKVLGDHSVDRTV